MMRLRSFRFLWIGQACANTGDVLYIVALIAILYQSTESAFYLSLLPFTITLARFISGMGAPLMLSHFALKGMLVWSQGLKTIVLGILGVSFLLYVPELEVVFMFAFIIAFLDGWAAPARNAMLPMIVQESELTQANSFVAVVDQSIQFGGWAVGGIIVAFTSGSFVIWLTFGLYCISTIMMAMIENTSKDQKRKRKIPLLSGWQTIWKHPILRTIHIMIFLESIANVVWIAAILYIFVSDVLQKSEAWWGYLNASFFFGLIAGGLIVSRYSRLFEKHMKLILLTTSFVVSGVTMLFGSIQIALLALALTVASGIVEQVKSIAIVTFIQKSCPKEALPEVFSAQSALISITFGCGTLLVGFLAEVVSIPFVFAFSGILLLSSALYMWKYHRHFQL
ncbi:MFS transporter [Guptibacillus hwajinpoensis]|uniref:MFS transporter n=1 Tax=Guptibacillus hwajinpoensis TaxID=208199 RepID=UPI00273A785F|nr:MFS transporter [Alkalihalobacillus macyae]